MNKIRLLLFSVFLFGLGTSAFSQDAKIHALFILKFVENVNWPQDRKDVVIGVIGKSEILNELDARLQVKNPNNITVKKISSADAATTCDVVFVPSSEDRQFNAVLNAAPGKAVLVITESDFSAKGSGISFFEEAGKLRFSINKSALEAKGLKVSGSLLSLGKQV